MDNVAHAPMGSSLSIAVDRLDKALEALEARVRALSNGEPIPEPESYGEAAPHPNPELEEHYKSLLRELDEVRERERQLVQAAELAFEALGSAAANIRILLRDEAA